MTGANDTGVLSERGWAVRRCDPGPSEPRTDAMRLVLQDISDKQIVRALGIFLNTACT